MHVHRNSRMGSVKEKGTDNFLSKVDENGKNMTESEEINFCSIIFDKMCSSKEQSFKNYTLDILDSIFCENSKYEFTRGISKDEDVFNDYIHNINNMGVL
jgi:hypothetical protein